MDDDTGVKILVLLLMLVLAGMSAWGGDSSVEKYAESTIHPVEDGRAWAESVDWICHVSGHLSGDVVLCDNNVPMRLLLVDAPEVEDGWIGAQARAFASNIMPVGSKLHIELGNVAEDRFGRVLAYLYDSEGTMVNLQMVRSGFAVARANNADALHWNAISVATEQAQAANAGLWRYPAFHCFAEEGRAIEECRKLPGGTVGSGSRSN